MENLRKMIDKDFIEVSKQKFSIPEISDEEIEKEIKSRYETPHNNNGFMDGAKWYREQIKQRH